MTNLNNRNSAKTMRDSQLLHDLEEIGVSTTDAELSSLLSIIDENTSFYSTVLRNKPNKSPSYLLLGLFTKLHIESLAFITTNHEKMNAMESVFNAHLPETHAKNFQSDDVNKLLTITKVWLYLQGFNHLDFSLANDHAHETATTIGKVKAQNNDEVRTQLLRYFYDGKQEKDTLKSGQNSSQFAKIFQRIADWIK